MPNAPNTISINRRTFTITIRTPLTFLVAILVVLIPILRILMFLIFPCYSYFSLLFLFFKKVGIIYCVYKVQIA